MNVRFRVAALMFGCASVITPLSASVREVPIGCRRIVEHALPGSNTTIADAAQDSDTVVLARYTRLLDEQIGCIGVTNCEIEIVSISSIQGAGIAGNRLRFSVATWRGEAVPTIGARYIFFIRTKGVDKPTAMKMLPGEEWIGAQLGPKSPTTRPTPHRAAETKPG